MFVFSCGLLFVVSTGDQLHPYRFYELCCESDFLSFCATIFKLFSTLLNE